jgi:hypothetical protein
MEYTWKIIKYRTRDEVNADGITLSDSVVSVDWKKTGTALNGVSSRYIGTTDISAASTAVADFVSLTDITEDHLIGWVQESLSAEDEHVINETIAKKIAKKNDVKRAANFS